MKKEYILISLIILIFSLLSVLIYNRNKNNNTNKQIVKDEEKYGEKMAIIKKKNGWYYYLYENTNHEYFFDGCNLKYNDLDGYYVNIYTDNSMKEIYYKMPTFPSLSTSDYSKNGVLERDEVVTINNFFNKQNFSEEITEKDLSGLQLNIFDKPELIKLFNDLTKKNFDYSVTPYHLNECDYKMDSLKEDYYVKIGFLVQRKGIAVMEIDLVYKNNKYLSDIIDSGKASQEQVEIYNNFQKIEEYVVSTQNLDILNHFEFDKEVYNRVAELLNGIGSAN